MKISEFIKELQSIIVSEGDLNVTWSNVHNLYGLYDVDDILTIRTYVGVNFLDIRTC